MPSQPKQAPNRFENSFIAEDGVTAVETLAAGTPLSKQQIKQAMQKGAVWLSRGVQPGSRSHKTRPRRLRRVKTVLHAGDRLYIYYDAHVLAQTVTAPQCIADEGHYSVWDKPAGMLSQGSKFGDHCALTRWIEKNTQPPRVAYLVHRLDRAASGLMLIAHDGKTAAELSALFRNREVEKIYSVTVEGKLNAVLPHKIDQPIDKKNAVSIIQSARHDAGKTHLRVAIETGRKHQIRRHLSEAGLPVLGDSLYGNGARGDALQLRAVSLRFSLTKGSDSKHYQLSDLG